MKLTKNRWLIAASAVGVHISIGSVYAYSAWKMPLENTFGWKATQTTAAFSIAIFFLGFSAAFLGRVIEKKGPRFGGLLSAVFFSLGLIGSGLACQWESLWLFYLSYGVIGGIGLGLGYISPVSTLVKWFPDRRGLATGLAIMGFGFGGLVCTLMIDQFVPKTSEIVVPVDATYLEYRQPEQFEELESGVETHKVVLYDAKQITHAFYFLAVIATAKKMGYEMVHLPVELASIMVMGISLFNGLILTAWSLAGIAGPMLNSAVYEQTHSYQRSLYIFGGVFVVALLISLLMRVELKRVQSATIHLT